MKRRYVQGLVDSKCLDRSPVEFLVSQITQCAKKAVEKPCLCRSRNELLLSISFESLNHAPLPLVDGTGQRVGDLMDYSLVQKANEEHVV